MVEQTISPAVERKRREFPLASIGTKAEEDGGTHPLHGGSFLLTQLLHIITSLVSVCLLFVCYIYQAFFFLWHLIEARRWSGKSKLMCLFQYKMCVVCNEADGRAESLPQRPQWLGLLLGKSNCSVSMPRNAKAEQRDREKMWKMLEKKEHTFPLKVIICSPCLCSHPAPHRPKVMSQSLDEHW